jgi:hypothetical protein
MLEVALGPGGVAYFVAIVILPGMLRIFEGVQSRNTQSSMKPLS